MAQIPVIYDEELELARPPEGYVLEELGAPFSMHNGPVFTKRLADGDIWRGFRVLKRHCNGFGTLHGGMLMAFTDNLLGYVTGFAASAPTLTMRLNADFLGMVRPGQWVDGHGWVTRKTKEIVFAQAELLVGERKVFTADGVFAAMQGRAERRQKREEN